MFHIVKSSFDLDIHGDIEEISTIVTKLPVSDGLADEIKKLLIIIDDLDRCDVENTLQLLALMKLFLGMTNCICITAVDFRRLEQAWIHKYGANNNTGNTGSEYLDKIFQIRIGMPRPTTEMITEYVKTLVSDMPNELLDLFSILGPENPRSIKRLLNLVSYRRSLLNSDSNDITAGLWTLLEVILSPGSAIFFYDVLKNKVGKTLGTIIKSDTSNDWNTWKPFAEKHITGLLGGPNEAKLEAFFSKSKSLVSKWGITAQDLDADFDILYSTTNEMSRR